MGRPEKPLSASLSPLVFGTATLNFQYTESPAQLPIVPLLHRALSSGVIAAFDTSPYYGPSESLLGAGLSHHSIRSTFPRESYTILTKVGRVTANCFDYSPQRVRRSVRRSLDRLRTDYLDVVYCHDVEFVTETEVVIAVRELRRIRDEEGTIKYVGISGYPVEVLCRLAERIQQETGEALDIVQSYSNCTLQNTRLLSSGIARLKAAGVDVVTNASPLSMGLLRKEGVPRGSMGDWHPSPEGLRMAVKDASQWLQSYGERLEVLAIRFALETWMFEGSVVGVLSDSQEGPSRLGVSVMGVSHLNELEDVLRQWTEIIDDHRNHRSVSLKEGPLSVQDPASLERQKRFAYLVNGSRDRIGSRWLDYTWTSPPLNFTREPPLVKDDEDVEGNISEAHLAPEIGPALDSVTVCA